MKSGKTIFPLGLKHTLTGFNLEVTDQIKDLGVTVDGLMRTSTQSSSAVVMKNYMSRTIKKGIVNKIVSIIIINS